MPIKHLVFSGGGPTVYKYLGALEQLEGANVFNSANIESVYGTSAGGMLGVVLSCKYDWTTIIDYFVKRPWHHAFKITPNDLFNVYEKKGIINQTFIDILFKPLFDAKDIPMNITMKGLFELSGIDLHLFTLELNSFEICDISHKTHPDLSVLTAVHMTSAIPVLFSPVCMEGKCYVDGGLVINYPLKYCLKDHSDEVNDILAFKNVYDTVCGSIGEDSNVVDVVVSICQHLMTRMYLLTIPDICLPNQINQPSSGLSVDYFQKTLESEDFRRELVEDGVRTARSFITKLSKTEATNPP